MKEKKRNKVYEHVKKELELRAKNKETKEEQRKRVSASSLELYDC